MLCVGGEASLYLLDFKFSFFVFSLAYCIMRPSCGPMKLVDLCRLEGDFGELMVGLSLSIGSKVERFCVLLF